MKTNLVRAASACAVFAAMSIAAPSAYAMHGSTWLVGILAIMQKGGASVGQQQTDENGRIVFKGLEKGDYELVIDGPTLRAAVDRLAPPAKSGGSSISIGGSLFGGGGSSRSSSGHEGAMNGHPDSGHGSSHSGGGLGLGVDIPVGGIGGDKNESQDYRFRSSEIDDDFTIAPLAGGPGNGPQHFSVSSPYCPDAKGDEHIQFTVPGDGGTVTLQMGISDQASAGNLTSY